jgi:hypothetical protein
MSYLRLGSRIGKFTHVEVSDHRWLRAALQSLPQVKKIIRCFKIILLGLPWVVWCF